MRTIVVGVIPLLLTGQAVVAQVQAEAPRYQINIGRQALGSALREFALQTHVQVAHFADVDQSLETQHAVVGDFTVQEALQLLLEGTSLRYEFVNDHTIAIRSPTSDNSKPETMPKGGESADGGPREMKRTGVIARIVALIAACGAVPHPGSVCAQESDSNRSAGQMESAGPVLQEIVVTATRREETINRVPLSITAMDQRTLDDLGVVSIDEISRLTPGVSMSRSGYADTTDISIRGIDSRVGTATTGVYIDDVPVQVRSLGFAAANLYPANFDFDRVEVLRGPQGTLFGAGSEGGTVRFITVQPSLTKYSGYARADYGFTAGGSSSRELGAAIGGPIIDQTLGFRVSAWARTDGGFIDRVAPLDGSVLQKNANSRNEYAARAALTWSADDVVKATLMGYYQEINKHGSDAYFESLSSVDDSVFRAADPLGSPTRDRFFEGALTVQAKLGSLFTLTSVTSVLWRNDVPIQDYSHFMPTLLFGPSLWDTSLTLPVLPQYTIASQFVNKQNNITEELRLQTANPDARLSGTVGFFFTNARQRSTQTLLDPMLPDFTNAFFGAPVEAIFGVPMLSPTVSYISDDRGIDKQRAVFGEGAYEVLPGLRVTAGVRYSSTHFDYTNFQAGPWAGTQGAGSAGSQRESPVTPKLGVSYQADPSNMYYATIAKGFRIGGANRPIPISSSACVDDLAALGLTNAPASYNSDHVWSYEIGAKNGLLGGHLQINSSLYLIRWSNIQQSVYLSHCGFNYVGNLGSGISKGGDIQIQSLVTRDLTLGMSVAYTDAYYDQTVFGGLGSSGERQIIVNNGDALPHSPWSAMVTGEYRFSLPGDLNSFVRMTYTYDSHLSRTLPTQDPITQGYDPDDVNAPAVHLADIRAGTVIGGAEISLYSNNLFNSHPRLTRFNDILGAKLFYDTTLVRTFGVRATYRF